MSAQLEPLTGFRYAPALRAWSSARFYGSLRDSVFRATQYVRYSAAPLCTAEPDIIHDVIGHGHLLATPTFSELHRLAGEATHRLRDDDNLEFHSKVLWFSLEVGVVIEDGRTRAYGAGLLSSLGKTDRFRNVEHRASRPGEDGFNPARHNRLSADPLPRRLGRRGARGRRRVLRDVHRRIGRTARDAKRSLRWQDTGPSDAGPRA